MKKAQAQRNFATAPNSAANFLAAWKSGSLGATFQSAASEQVYRLYLLWCASTGEAFPLQHTVLSAELVRLCTAQAIVTTVKVMAVNLDPEKPKARMFLVTPPPFKRQGEWAAQLATEFEAQLQAIAASQG